MNRTRWLMVGIVILRVLVFFAALIVGRSGSGVGRTLIQTEAGMLTAIAVWLLMLYFLPRLRDASLAVLDARRGVWRAALYALAMLGIVIGAAIVVIVGRNIIFAGTLTAILLLALEFSSGVLLSSIGFHLRRLLEPNVPHHALVDLIIGAQLLTVLVTIRDVAQTLNSPLLIRILALTPIIALGYLALGVLAHLVLSAIPDQSAST